MEQVSGACSFPAYVYPIENQKKADRDRSLDLIRRVRECANVLYYCDEGFPQSEQLQKLGGDGIYFAEEFLVYYLEYFGWEKSFPQLVEGLKASNKISKALSEIGEKKVEDINEESVSVIVRELLNRIQVLNEGEALYFPGGSNEEETAHLVMYKVSRSSEGYAFTIYNLGEGSFIGCSVNPDRPVSYIEMARDEIRKRARFQDEGKACPLIYQGLKLEDLDQPLIEQLFLFLVKNSPSHSIEKLYAFINDQFRGKAVLDEGPPQAIQYATNCTFVSPLSLVLHELQDKAPAFLEQMNQEAKCRLNHIHQEATSKKQQEVLQLIHSIREELELPYKPSYMRLLTRFPLIDQGSFSCRRHLGLFSDAGRDFEALRKGSGRTGSAKG